MKRIMSICVILCSFVLLGGCVNMTQNNEIKETLEKAFNTAQGNDLFEVGKQVLDTYAPSEESVYIVSSYASGWVDKSDFYNTFNRSNIEIVVKYERNKKDLKARLLFMNVGEETPSVSIDLIYRGVGKYYTLDNVIYKPLDGVVLLCENKELLKFENFKNIEIKKNPVGDYIGSSKEMSLSFYNNTIQKVNSLLKENGARDNSKTITESKGGMSYRVHGEEKNKIGIDVVLADNIRNMEVSSTVTTETIDNKYILE